MLDKLHFNALVDLPLAAATLIGFFAYFQAWTHTDDVDITVDLSSRLPKACFRVTCLIAVIVAVCWVIGFAVWAIFAFLVAIGLALGALSLADVSGGGIIPPVLTAHAIREWAFGFPQLVLHPPGEKRTGAQQGEPNDELVGRQGATVSPLRPCGEAIFDGKRLSVISESGEFLDVGTDVAVVGRRSGQVCVRAR